MENEIWKDIKGYEGIYQISNLGRVKSFHKRMRKKLFLNNHLTLAGYYQIELNKDGKQNRTTTHLHQLIAIYFIPNPENKPCVNHINGIKTDNRIENLEWVTHSENTKHAYAIGLKERPNSKLEMDDVYDIKIIHKMFGLTQNEIGKKFNVSGRTICDVLRNKSYKSLPINL